MNKCKRCGIKTVLSEEDIRRMTDEIRSMRNVRLSDDDEYGRRLEICRVCDKLMYGSTCAACGCVVQVRALPESGRCPRRKW